MKQRYLITDHMGFNLFPKLYDNFEEAKNRAEELCVENRKNYYVFMIMGACKPLFSDVKAKWSKYEVKDES